MRSRRIKLAGARISALTLSMLLPLGSVFALDTSLQTDFWDTSGYKNATPSLAVSETNADDFLSFSFNEKASAAFAGKFSSFRPGFVFIIH
jgi:hypothetical protein